MRRAGRPAALPLLAALLALGGGGCAGSEEASGDASVSGAAGGGPLEINGSTTVNPVVARAAEELAAERGWEIRVDTQGGSSGGISSLADGRVDVGMASRPLTEEDRERFPEVDFRPVAIAHDALALVVSKEVWEGGVRDLDRDEVRGLYEGRITSWSEVGGPDRRVVFFNKEPGRGTWEVFADWLYGDAREAPRVSHPEVGSNEEARSKVGSTPGAVSQLSAAWADGESVFALGIRGEDGTVTRPDAETLAAGEYPLARPLLVITDGPPDPREQALLDLLLGPRGRELARESGYEPVASTDAEAAAGNVEAVSAAGAGETADGERTSGPGGEIGAAASGATSAAEGTEGSAS